MIGWIRWKTCEHKPSSHLESRGFGQEIWGITSRSAAVYSSCESISVRDFGSISAVVDGR